MSGAIAWQVELAIRPGELENFRTLTRVMVESTQDERGVLIYERFVSADGTVVYVYERYADSAATVAHLLAFAHMYGERLAQLVERRRFMVFGTPSAELQRILNRFDAIYLRPFDGCSLLQQEERRGVICCSQCCNVRASRLGHPGRDPLLDFGGHPWYDVGPGGRTRRVTAKVVRCTVFLKSLEDFAVMNAVYATFFPAHPPARSTLEVARLPQDCLVEIDAIALDQVSCISQLRHLERVA